MSRNNIKSLEEEINFLKITIQHFNNENIEMKNQIEDLKITLNSDKRLLQEYLLQISHKDSTVIKLNHTVDQLKKRLENLETQPYYTKKIIVLVLQKEIEPIQIILEPDMLEILL